MKSQPKNNHTSNSVQCMTILYRIKLIAFFCWPSKKNIDHPIMYFECYCGIIGSDYSDTQCSLFSQLDDVDRLSVIHVSGTKGKGSTCAFCESILRHQGYRTGFFRYRDVSIHQNFIYQIQDGRIALKMYTGNSNLFDKLPQKQNF